MINILADSTSEEFLETDGVEEYQNVMSNLKRKPSYNEVNENPSRKSAPALLNSNEVLVDDWLEDDLVQTKTVKKRRLDPMSSVFSSAGPSGANSTHVSPRQRNSSSPQKKAEISRKY